MIQVPRYTKLIASEPVQVFFGTSYVKSSTEHHVYYNITGAVKAEL